MYSVDYCIKRCTNDSQLYKDVTQGKKSKKIKFSIK